jgi:hypothetical protein
LDRAESLLSIDNLLRAPDSFRTLYSRSAVGEFFARTIGILGQASFFGPFFLPMISMLRLNVAARWGDRQIRPAHCAKGAALPLTGLTA